MDIKKGDIIRITYLDKTYTDGVYRDVTIEGEVRSAFNCLDSSGDQWEYEIKSADGKWFLYREKTDGGKVVLIKRASS